MSKALHTPDWHSRQDQDEVIPALMARARLSIPAALDALSAELGAAGWTCEPWRAPGEGPYDDLYRMRVADPSGQGAEVGIAPLTGFTWVRLTDRGDHPLGNHWGSGGEAQGLFPGIQMGFRRRSAVVPELLAMALDWRRAADVRAARRAAILAR